MPLARTAGPLAVGWAMRLAGSKGAGVPPDSITPSQSVIDELTALAVQRGRMPAASGHPGGVCNGGGEGMNQQHNARRTQSRSSDGNEAGSASEMPGVGDTSAGSAAGPWSSAPSTGVASFRAVACCSGVSGARTMAGGWELSWIPCWSCSSKCARKRLGPNLIEAGRGARQSGVKAAEP